jgi:hypothetical protein
VPTIEGKVSASFSQFEIHAGEGGAVAPLDIGLAWAEEPDYAALTTARQVGDVPVIVTLHEARPDLDPAWDAVVELSMLVGEGPAVTGWASEGATLPLPLHSGTEVRVRYVVIDGDAGSRQFHDRDDDGPARDRYLLQVWPEALAPAAVIVSSTPWSQYSTFGAEGRLLYDVLAGAEHGERIVAAVDAAIARHPDVAARVRSGDAAYRTGIIGFVTAATRLGSQGHVREALDRIIDERVLATGP